MTQKINCYQAALSYVKAFFEAFATGILDGKTTDNKKKQYTTQEEKTFMIAFYQHLNPIFMELVAPMLAKLTYRKAETLTEKLREAFQDKAPDAKQYLKIVCRTPRLYEAVVSEYQHNFALLLQGRLNVKGNSYTMHNKGIQLAFIDKPTAIHLLVRLIIKTYVKALQLANPQKVSLDQASVYRLILTNLLVMRGETQIKEMPNDLYELFKMACGNEVNMNVTYNAMTEIYRELATEDHIIAFDDQAN